MRVVLAVGGPVVLLVGWAAWSLETEYGGNGVIGSATSKGITRVFDINEQSLDDELQSVTTIVFEGTEAEARAFMEQRWNEGRNYTIPALILALGGIMVMSAFVPSIGHRSGGDQTEVRDVDSN
jgi:hypothetical protein